MLLCTIFHLSECYSEITNKKQEKQILWNVFGEQSFYMDSVGLSFTVSIIFHSQYLEKVLNNGKKFSNLKMYFLAVNLNDISNLSIT